MKILYGLMQIVALVGGCLAVALLVAALADAVVRL
jgi:hypothetical protein